MIAETILKLNGNDVAFPGDMVTIESVKARFRNAESLLWILKNSEILDII